MKGIVVASVLALLPVSAWAAGPAGSVEGQLGERALKKTIQLVYVEKVDGDEATKPLENMVMNQRNNTYLPHVMPVTAGTKVAFHTEDPELHNIYAKADDKVIFNTALPAGAPAFYRTFDKPGIIALTCNIHSEMSAFIVVLQNKYAALPDAETGKWKIEGLAPGSYTVKIWGEKLDDALKAKSFPVTVKAGASTTLEISSKVSLNP